MPRSAMGKPNALPASVSGGLGTRRPVSLLALLLCLPLGCGQTAQPEEKAPPATAKWEGPSRGALEEWTELVGTTMPLPDRIARITAVVEGKVVAPGFWDWPATEGQLVRKGTV